MKLRNIKLKNKGFTIIEVVLVLAIAGLIMAAVFVAVPALQQNQRDTAKRTLVNNVLSGVQTYTTNNNGSLPTAPSPSWDASGVTLPSGTTIDVVAASASAQSTTANKIYVMLASKCPTGASTNGSITLSGNSVTNAFAVYTRLEGNNNSVYCVNN